MASSAQWACSACTYLNQPSSQLCEICNTMNPSSNDNKGGVSNWKCVLCTFVNPAVSEACGVCGSPSPLHNDLSGKKICGHCTSINYANVQTCKVCGQPLSNKILQLDDNGQLQSDKPSMDVDQTNNDDKNKSNVNKNSKIDNSNNNPMQYANPFSFNDDLYQPNNQPFQQQQQQQQYPSYQPYQPYQPTHSMPPQQQDFSGMFSFGNINNNNHSKHSSHSSKKRRSKKNKYNKYSNNNGNNDDNKNDDIQFKDVTEIFKKDENDTIRIKKEDEDIKILSEWYSKIYLTKEKNYNIKIAGDIVEKMMEFIPDDHWKEVKSLKEKNKEQKQDFDVCQVCFCEFDEDDGKLMVMKKHCGHAMICKSCFKQHLKIKIKEDEITPWLLCASPNCKAPVCVEYILKHLTLKELFKFCGEFIRKHLARNPNWIPCKTKNCKYGFVIMDKNKAKEHKVKCDSCRKSQKVCKDPIKSDKGFNDLIKNGTLRLCPKCSLPTMKDKGMCNIMHCGKCGIYWNWRTRETGTSSSQLKNKARNNGTLWEPGELQYQMNLQKTNKAEFKLLLERNGIKYDPNYRRGQR